jgi:hypothetical protein
VERINFAAQQVQDLSKPGVQMIVERLRAASPLTAEGLIDQCLDLVGPLAVSQNTRDALLHYARLGGDLRFGTAEEAQTAAQRVSDVLQLIVASREFQLN